MEPLRLKLDENLGESLAGYLRAQGHEVHTTGDEGLNGCSDPEVWEACCAENRYLVTSDLDFANPRDFDPVLGSGLFVLRSRRQSVAAFRLLADRVVEHLRTDPSTGELWIVTETRIRPYDA